MPDNEQMRPEDLIMRIISAAPSEQRKIAQQMIANAQIAATCGELNHDGRLADLQARLDQATARYEALDVAYEQAQSAYRDVWRWWAQSNIRADKIHDVINVLPEVLEGETLQQQVETLTKAIDRIQIVTRSLHTRPKMTPEDRLFMMMILNPDTLEDDITEDELDDNGPQREDFDGGQ